MAASTEGTTSTGTGTPSLGPNQLQPDSGSSFILSKPEFVAVQTYVDSGTRLPSSEQEMQLKLGINAEDVKEFTDLIAAYKNVNDHCAYFKSTIFPMSVGLASDIVSYNTKVLTYYGALKTLILQWQDGTIGGDLAKKKFQQILGNLRDQAKGYSDTAGVVKQKMIDFTEETKNDQSILQPIDERYKAKYQGKGGEVDTFMKEIQNDTDQIKLWNKEYEHDVTVAATSATYAWIFPVGTIAAAIVAGIYGKKATDALNNVHSYQDKLQAAEEGLRRALNLLHDLKLCTDSLDGILDSLNKALPVLEKMEGIWGAISDDLNNIVNQILDKDIGQADLFIKDLGVDEAITAWEKVSRIADNYRMNAYITVTTEEAAKEAGKQAAA
jgi:hypothetical protein